LERQPIQAQSAGYNRFFADFFVDDRQHPYETAPGKPFLWIRGRLVGGRLPSWGRVCLRMSQRELKAASADGFGHDWPLDEADLAPYCSLVEKLLRVTGTQEGLPDFPDGSFLPSPKLSRMQRLLRTELQKRMGTTLIAGRLATRDVTGWMSSVEKKRSIQLRPNSTVVELEADRSSGLIQSVIFRDSTDGTLHRVRCRVVFLCASAIESVRVVLASSLKNISRATGRFFMDHTSAFLTAVDPRVRLKHDVASRAKGPAVSHVPPFSSGNGAFLRSFGLQIYSFDALPFLSSPAMDPVIEAARSEQRGFVLMYSLGETLPRDTNRVTLSARVKDGMGLAAPRIEYAYGENERKLIRAQLQTLREVAQVTGLHVVETRSPPPGFAAHELGGLGMGHAPEDSVTNAYGQLWGIPNVFAADGAAFPSGGWRNPTLTMMALALRSTDVAIHALKTFGGWIPPLRRGHGRRR
jgi:choline dehydrogenase-like flavoprotein